LITSRWKHHGAKSSKNVANAKTRKRGLYLDRE
jgi:hypothetical protein